MEKSTNVVWHSHTVTREFREKIKNQLGVCIWFTGLSASGKSTIASELEYELSKLGIHTYLLDGDNVRHGLNKDLGFSDADRHENIRRLAEVTKLFVDAGIVVLTAFISPFKEERDFARSLLDEGRFLEVFVEASIETCEERDPKGLYKKARAGEIRQFTGIDSPYEKPESPEIVVKNNAGSNIPGHVLQILNYLSDNKIIHKV